MIVKLLILIEESAFDAAFATSVTDTTFAIMALIFALAITTCPGVTAAFNLNRGSWFCKSFGDHASWILIIEIRNLS